MKTIYTDRYGLFAWAMLFVTGVNFWQAYTSFQEGDGKRLGLSLAVGTLFLILAIKRFWDIRQARREGRDPTILRIKNAPDQ